jgi:hypothetical protein
VGVYVLIPEVLYKVRASCVGPYRGQKKNLTYDELWIASFFREAIL